MSSPFCFHPRWAFPGAVGIARTVGANSLQSQGAAGLGCVGQQVWRKATVGNKADAPELPWHVAQAQEGWKGTQTPASQRLPQPTAGSLIHPAHDRCNRRGQAGRRGSCRSLRTGPSPLSGLSPAGPEASHSPQYRSCGSTSTQDPTISSFCE